MADNGLLSVDQKVKVVLFYAETECSSDSETLSCTLWYKAGLLAKQTIYRLSLGTIFQPMRINSVPDVKWFCNDKNVLCV